MYITRVSSVAAADVLKTRKAKGQNVFGETLASALGMSVKANVKKSPLLITSPPINSNVETKTRLFTLLSL